MDSEQVVAIGRSVPRGRGFLAHARGWKVDRFGIALSLVIVQLLLVALSGVRWTKLAVLERSEIHMNVVDGVTDQRVQEIYAALSALPSVREVAYMTREQVYQDERSRDASLGDFLERYGMENPFSDAFVVTPKTARAYGDLRVFLGQEEHDGVIDPSTLADIGAQEETARQLLDVVDTVRTGVGVLLGLAAFVVMTLSMSALRRIRRQREETMYAEALAGALPAVVAMPGRVAGITMLFGAWFMATILAGAVIVVLAIVPASDAVGSWITRASIDALPLVPVALLVEIAVLFLFAWIAGRPMSAHHSR